jgi:heme/copper-type cytochrome/quinol oxidase subunit 3
MNLPSSRDQTLRIAVWSVIASEALMFAALLAMRAPPVPRAPTLPAISLAVVVGGALFGGGAMLANALRRACEGRLRAAGRLLATAVALGFGALVLELAAARVSAVRDPIAMIVVGLHAAHVAASIALATWVLALVRCGRVFRGRYDVLSLVSSYWTFVSIVWVFVWPLFVGARP